MEQYTFQILISLLSSIIGGGILIAWIEFQRLRREKSEWKLKDKKIELKLLSISATETKWDASGKLDEKEKLRIYETNLDGKIKKWIFLVKIIFTNLTDHAILITTAALEIPQPNIEKAKKNDKYREMYYSQELNSYDLMNKTVIIGSTYPLVIQPKMTSGIVYLGEWEFDFPHLVSNVPQTATYKIKLDDGSTRQLNIDFTNAVEISELAYSDLGNPHWEPALSYSKEEINKYDADKIPF